MPKRDFHQPHWSTKRDQSASPSDGLQGAQQVFGLRLIKYCKYYSSIEETSFGKNNFANSDYNLPSRTPWSQGISVHYRSQFIRFQLSRCNKKYSVLATSRIFSIKMWKSFNLIRRSLGQNTTVNRLYMMRAMYDFVTSVQSLIKPFSR